MPLSVPSPSFFRQETEKALISQVKWLQTEVQVSDGFFSNMLSVGQDEFKSWKNGTCILTEEQQDTLKGFWQTTLHILSLLDFDPHLLQTMLEYKPETPVAQHMPLDPPWVGTSLKTYLETKGPFGIRKVCEWAQAISFANWY